MWALGFFFGCGHGHDKSRAGVALPHGHDPPRPLAFVVLARTPANDSVPRQLAPQFPLPMPQRNLSPACTPFHVRRRMVCHAPTPSHLHGVPRPHIRGRTRLGKAPACCSMGTLLHIPTSRYSTASQLHENTARGATAFSRRAHAERFAKFTATLCMYYWFSRPAGTSGDTCCCGHLAPLPAPGFTASVIGRGATAQPALNHSAHGAPPHNLSAIPFALSCDWQYRFAYPVLFCGSPFCGFPSLLSTGLVRRPDGGAWHTILLVRA